MSTTVPNLPENAKTEYQAGLEQYRSMAALRRQEMAFATTVQAAVFTIIGPRLLQFGISDFILSVIAFFVLILGLNSERRLTAYMSTYMRRVAQIESAHGMSMFSDAGKKTVKNRWLFSNARVFPIYYCLFGVAWLVVWISNLWKRR